MGHPARIVRRLDELVTHVPELVMTPDQLEKELG
jgi:hypothetical protein